MRSTTNPIVGVAVAVGLLLLGLYVRTSSASESGRFLGTAFVVVAVIAAVGNLLLWRATRK